MFRLIVVAALIGLSLSPGCPRPAPEVPGGPDRIVYVDAASGSDSSGDGTEMAPWKSIAHALNRIGPHVSASNRYSVTIAPGDYDERLVLKRYVTLQGRDTGDAGAVRIFPGLGTVAGGLAAGDAVLTVEHGLEGDSGIRNLSIAIPENAPEGVRLLRVAASVVRVDGVVFEGNGAAGSIAVDLSSPASSASLFSRCLFRGVHNGVLASNSAARFTFNIFENISGAAVLATPQSSKQLSAPVYPILGSTDECGTTAGNVFRADTINPPTDAFPVAGPIIDTGITSDDENIPDLLAQGNIWEGEEFRGALNDGDYDAAARQVGERVSDNVKTEAPAFEVSASEKPILASTIVVVAVNALTDESIENATLTAESGPRISFSAEGILAVTLDGPGLYRVQASADGFAPGTECVVVDAGGELVAVTVVLTPLK